MARGDAMRKAVQPYEVEGQMNFLDFPEILPESANPDKLGVDDLETEEPEVEELVTKEPEEPDEPEKVENAPIEYDRHTLEGMISDVREVLELMSEYWLANQPLTYAKYNMQKQAYEMLLRAHDAEEERKNET